MDNSTEVIEAGKTFTLKTYVMGLENPKEITNAKIKYVGEETESATTQALENMVPDDIEIEEE